MGCMADVVLFHHAQGLTPGCLSLASRIRRAGHNVHTPDLYQGRTFADLAAGVVYAGEVGYDTLVERARAVELPAAAVYVGVSLGVLPAQMLAQSRPGALGAVLISAAVPPAELGGGWPEQVPLQIHMMDGDPIVSEEGDRAAAEEMAASIAGAELHLYSGSGHLFVDDSLADYDEAATDAVVARILGISRDPRSAPR